MPEFWCSKSYLRAALIAAANAASPVAPYQSQRVVSVSDARACLVFRAGTYAFPSSARTCFHLFSSSEKAKVETATSTPALLRRIEVYDGTDMISPQRQRCFDLRLVSVTVIDRFDAALDVIDREFGDVGCHT